jgi:hypothetical protein
LFIARVFCCWVCLVSCVCFMIWTCLSYCFEYGLNWW